MLNSKTLVQLAPWIFVFLWSTGFVGAKYTLPYAEPFTLLWIRMSITALVFLVLIWIFNAKKLTVSLAFHQMVVGALFHVGYLGGVFAAISLGMPAGVSAIIVGLQPILTVVIALFWFDERLIWRQWLGLVCGFVGIAIVLYGGEKMGDFEVTKTTLMFSFVSVVSISVGTLYQKRFGKGVDIITGSFFQYLMAAILLGIIAFSFETRQVDWGWPFIFGLVWLIFVLSIAAVLLLMYLIRVGEAAKVASYFYLVPVSAATLTWFLFDEKLSLTSIFGMILTVLGIYLVIKASKRATY